MPYQIAHRGVTGGGVAENTRAAFRAAKEDGLHGIEFDVRWSEKREDAVVCHYAWQEDAAELLEEVLEELSLHSFSILLLELKEYHLKLWLRVRGLLVQHKLIEHTVVFAFPRVAEKFPWREREGMKLGIITLFPWQVKKYAKLKPSVILFGYDRRPWTRFLFRLIWWDAGMRRLFRIHPDVAFIAGVAQNEKHIAHLESIDGLHGYTVDKCR